MTIVVCPLDDAAEACRRYAPSHVVSLLAPPAGPPELETDAARLHLSFNDIVEPRDGLVAPNAAHIEQLLAFLADWDRRSPLLIHCWAGVSRSTAAAFVAASLREGAGSEQRLSRALRDAAPFATPNRLIVALADHRMGRNGAMAAAIDGIGRGAECAKGVLFEL